MSNTLMAGRPSARKSPAATLASLSDEAGSTRRVNFDLSADLHTRLKIYATRRGQSIKEVLTEYVAGLPE